MGGGKVDVKITIAMDECNTAADKCESAKHGVRAAKKVGYSIREAARKSKKKYKKSHATRGGEPPRILH